MDDSLPIVQNSTYNIEVATVVRLIETGARGPLMVPAPHRISED